jgi:hypothetical protein
MTIAAIEKLADKAAPLRGQNPRMGTPCSLSHFFQFGGCPSYVPVGVNSAGRGQAPDFRMAQTAFAARNSDESDTIAVRTAPQEELAMYGIEVRGFKNGKWTEAKAPEWFDRVADTDEAWTEAFRHHNLVPVDEFDCGDSIEISRAENGTYCVVFRDTFQAFAVVFIEAASDYIQFRAQVIAPNVQLMMASKQLDEWDRARQLRRAS